MSYKSELLLLIWLVAANKPYWGLGVLGEIYDLIKSTGCEKFYLTWVFSRWGQKDCLVCRIKLDYTDFIKARRTSWDKSNQLLCLQIQVIDIAHRCSQNTLNVKIIHDEACNSWLSLHRSYLRWILWWKNLATRYRVLNYHAWGAWQHHTVILNANSADLSVHYVWLLTEIQEFILRWIIGNNRTIVHTQNDVGLSLWVSRHGSIRSSNKLSTFDLWVLTFLDVIAFKLTALLIEHPQIKVTLGTNSAELDHISLIF